MTKTIFYIVNVDWYFKLHWLDRALAAQSSGFTVYVLCAYTSEDIKAEFMGYGFRCIPLPIHRSGLNLIKELRVVRLIYGNMAKIRPDIVHAITIKPNIYAGMCANKLGIPSIKSVTGLGAVYTSRKLIFRLLKPLIECLYKFVGCSGRGVFIFENSSDYSVFQNYHLSSAQELQHIPGAGVDLDAFRFHPKAEVGREVSVLFAARLLKDKGLGALVGAVEIVNQSSLIPVKLLVAGIFDHDALDAYTEQEIESLATAGKIQWLGKCDDMPQLLERVDIVALPTCYGEGIPRVLIEAGAVGRVVVCSNVPGCNEFVEHRHNGLLVPPHNTNALSSALLELINSSGDREKFSRNLRKKVELEYSNGAVISSFLATYSRLL